MNTNQQLLAYEQLKKCPKCKTIKDISDFPKNRTRKDGRGSTCKECDKKNQKEYQSKNKKIILEKKRTWYHENIIEARAKNHKPGRIEKIKEWYRKNSHKVIERNKELREKNPNKFKARNFVNNSIKLGKIPKPSTLKCFRCGKQAKEYHHHKGYDRDNWLNVVPMCRTCHDVIEHPLPSSAIL